MSVPKRKGCIRNERVSVGNRKDSLRRGRRSIRKGIVFVLKRKDVLRKGRISAFNVKSFYVEKSIDL
jgi:hypothetical protein